MRFAAHSRGGGPPGRGALQDLHLRLAMNHCIEPMGSHVIQFVRGLKTLEDKNSLIDARLAKDGGFIDTRNGEGIGLLQSARDTNETVPVPVRFDDGEYPRSRGMDSDLVQVVAQGGEIDNRSRRSRHG